MFIRFYLLSSAIFSVWLLEWFLMIVWGYWLSSVGKVMQCSSISFAFLSPLFNGILVVF